jgi:hypothetical protein
MSAFVSTEWTFEILNAGQSQLRNDIHLKK